MAEQTSEDVESNNEIKAEDHIREKPDLIKSIEDEETAKIVRDELYFPILKVLRKGPMTVKEIVEEYNSIAKSEKSDKTIYRYLRVLQDYDLVKPAGQRVVFGKTATETLFCRTAYAIYIRNEMSEFWHTDEGKRLSKAIGELLNPVIGIDKTPNVEKIQSFMGKISNTRLNTLKKHLETIDKKILEDISDLDWQRFTAFYNMGGILAVLLENPDILDELKDCFE